MRAVFAVILWIAALTPPCLFALSASSPESATALAASASAGLRLAGMAAVAAVALGLLLYPPFLPSLRLKGRRLRDRMSVDQGPMLGALERLRHLETAPDHLIVARTLRNMGQVTRALPHLVRAVELDRDGVSSRFLLGQAALRVGHLPTAIEQLSLVVEREENHAYGEPWVELASALERAGRDDEALARLARHEELYGEHRRAFMLRAKILARRGEAAEARRLLERAARPPEEGVRMPPEDALARAQARVALLRGPR